MLVYAVEMSVVGSGEVNTAHNPCLLQFCVQFAAWVNLKKFATVDCPRQHCMTSLSC